MRLTGVLFRHIFQSLLSRLESGDIVWCHSQPSFCAVLERSIHARGAKLIYHAHSSLAPYFERSRFHLFSADAVIFVSEAMRQEALQFLPQLKNTCVIYNGASEDIFYPLPSGSVRNDILPIILYVGRLDPVKGVHVLMDAMRILQKRNVNALCKVVGTSFSGGSTVTAYVKSLIRSSPPNVQFVGYLPAEQLAREYRAAAILCCPSIYQEPFGIVNIEAMASGIPVVATRVGGIPEIAADGGVLLVDSESAVELSDALQRLIEDKNLRMKVAAEGLGSFQRRFTWTGIHRQYQELVERLCATTTEATAFTIRREA